MIPSDQIPPGQDYLMRRLTDLERQVRELAAGRRLEAATIGAGGLTVQGGGEVVIRDTDGRRIIRLGRVPFGDGSTKPGLVAFRTTADGGTAAMSLFDGIFAVWDRKGNIVMSTDEASGQGAGRPYLPAAHFGISFNSELFGQIPGTTSGAFVGLLETRTPATHPRLRLLAYVGGTDGPTTAEGRMFVNGTVVATSGGDGWINAFVAVPGWGTTVGYLEEIEIRLEVRRTAGTGRAIGQVYACYGVES